jgi:hypothetical protein
MYANDELFINAVARGERAFMKMLSGGEVVGRKLFDQILYPLTAEQEAACRKYGPTEQDFDMAYRHLNVISRDVIDRVRRNMEAGYPNSTVITIDEQPLYQYRQAAFFKVRDYKAHRKYRMLPRMAAVKVFGRLYVALNAVNIHVKVPIIVTVGTYAAAKA